MANKFKALVVREIKENQFKREIEEKTIDELPAGDILIRVHYSSLNYKDALSAKGHKGITRKYPHTPGIDAAGVIEESLSSDFKVGDKVIVTGYDLGMNTSGGFSQYIRVPSSWVVKLPEGITLKESMIYGTAGFTSGLCLYEFQRRGTTPEKGKIVVTGATGGVGSIAISLLAKLGYSVTASTGKLDKTQFLMELGAKEVIDRDKLIDTSGKPLLPRIWAGAVENVGGITLSTVIRSTDYWGTVACVGLVGSDKLDITVYPFLLRGVALVGIDSADRPMELRKKIWHNLSTEWKIDTFDKLHKEITFNELNFEIDKILEGKQCGRVVVKISD